MSRFVAIAEVFIGSQAATKPFALRCWVFLKINTRYNFLITARTAAAYFYTKLIVASCIKAELCEVNLRASAPADDSEFDFFFAQKRQSLHPNSLILKLDR